MTIYECLGISEFLIDETIPVDLIIENIDRDNLKHDADVFFRDIERVSIRASFNRGNHYMQVIEVELNSADYIEEISMLIQNAIRYPILFIFVYKERYLLIRRNFNLTMSTEHVSSIHIGFCSNWIYKEHLEDDLVSLLDSEEIVDYYDEEFELQEEPVKTVVDNGDYYFDDIIGNAIKLNYTIINSDVICLRFLIDWFKLHIAGSRIGIYELLNYIYRAQAYQMIGEHLFVEKDCISYALSELEHSRYMLSFGKTGRRPVVYFKGIKDLATHTEADNLMSYLLNGNIVSFDVEVSGEEIVSRELKKYIHFVPSNTMPVAPTYCASKSRFVDRTIYRYQLGKYHSIEDQDLRYIIVRKLRNNGYRKLEQFRSISIKTMDFLDEAMTIELLLCMDKYKIRFKECEKNKYPDIGDYIKAHYCCTECGEELDEIHCLNGKCLCKSCNQKSNVNTSEMVEESENNIIIANELARFEKNSSHIQSIDIDNSIEKYEDYTISINTIVLKQKRLAVCFDLKTADNSLIKNLEVKDVFLELNSGKVYLDEPYKISKLINGMEDNGDAILINKVFLYWNSTNENFTTDRPRYIHLVLQNTYTSTHCLYDFEIKADDKVELCKCIGELDYLEYKKQITKQNVKRILSVIQNNIHDRASIKICLDNISITEVKSLFDSQYVVEDGVVYDKNKTTLIMCIGRERIDSIIIPDTVETICRNAFSDTRIIDDIVFSNQLKKIEAEAFLGVCFVNKINLPNTITEIAEKAFYKSTIPSDYINIPTSLENIGDNIFPLEWSLWHPISWNTISKNIKDTFFTANYKMIFGAEHRPMFIDSGMNYDFSWEYNVENELHIFATGDFSQTRWESDRETEWREYAGEIKKLIFHEGITSISGNAFEGCNNISEVILPSTLCHLNAYTLKDTIWYKNLSSGFVTVGDGCLVKAKTDETILVIPENVKYVSRVVDSISTRDKLCPNVKHIELGNNVHTLLPFAFADSSIESVLFNANLIELKQGCLSSCRELKFICLPNSVEIIGYSAFAHSKDLRCIVLSESLKVIDCTAFNGCNKLKKIIVPFSKKEFSKKVQTSLGHDSFPYSKCIYSTTVENRCIKSENELILRNNVIRKEDTKNLMRENDEKLLSKHPIIRAYLATKLRKYGLRTMDDLKKWGAKNVWKHVYENEKHYKLSFNNLVKLVMAEEGIDELSEERLIELYEFADSVAGQKIERKLLSDYREDDSFIGEDTLSKETKHKAHPLVEESFKSQKISSQNEIDVVDSGKTLDFSWELNSKNELYITARGEFSPNRWYSDKDSEWRKYALKIEKLFFSTGIISIAGNSFSGCKNIREIVFPNTLQYLDSTTFKETIWYKDISEKFFTVADSCLIKAITEDDILAIPDSVKYISNVTDSILSQNKLCPNVKHIMLGKNVRILLPYAFSNSLAETITFNNGLTELAQGCFASCCNIEFICLPNSVKKIGDSAFAYSSKLQCVVLPEGLETITHNAFKGCEKLEKIIVPFSYDVLSKKVETFFGHNMFPYDKCIYSAIIDNRNITTEAELLMNEYQKTDDYSISQSVNYSAYKEEHSKVGGDEYMYVANEEYISIQLKNDHHKLVCVLGEIAEKRRKDEIDRPVDERIEMTKLRKNYAAKLTFIIKQLINKKVDETETLRLEEERLLAEKERLLEEERLKEKARIAEAKRRYIEREKANRKGSNFYTGSIKVNNTNDTSENGNQYAEDKYAEEKARIAEAKRRYIERERTVHKNIESELNIVDSKKYTVSSNQEQITFNGFEDASLVHEQLSLESIRDDLEVEEKANNDEMLYIEKLFGERKPLVYVLNQIREKRCNEEIERLVAKRAQAVEQLKKYSVQLIDVLAQIADKKTKEAEEEVLRIAEQKRLEEARTAEEKRKQEEARRYEEECRKAEETRILEEQLRVEKMRQLEEELQKAEEAVRRLEEEKRQAEEKRIAEEKRRAEEAKHLEERIKAERMKESYRKEKRCQYCGGKFKGIFKKRCSVCGKPKDY